MSNSQTGILHPTRATRHGVVAAICLILSSAAFADIQDIQAANNQVVAQLQRNSVTYTETVIDQAGNEGPLDSESGRITRYGLSFSAMRDLWLGRDYFDVRYSSYSGKTSYIGGTAASPAYGSVVGESGATIRDSSLRYGTGFVLDPQAMATLYGELGRHKYVRTLGLGTPAGYQESYMHNYYGLGALVQYSPVDKIVFSFNALVGRTYQARMVAVLPPPYAAFSANLGNGSVKKIGFLLDYALTKHIHANAGLEMMSWSYGASASQPISSALNMYEPDSTTYITTAKVGIGFAF